MFRFSHSQGVLGPATVALMISFVGVTSALAVGGSGAAKPAHLCRTGYVYSEKARACVETSANLMDDEALFQQGRALAEAGHYDEALIALAAVKDQNNSMVLTMIGYSKRKLGNWEEGMAFYRQALAIDPDNVNAREYLGEAWLAKGRADLARVQLIRIGAICGTDCEQYLDLEKRMRGETEMN